MSERTLAPASMGVQHYLLRKVFIKGNRLPPGFLRLVVCSLPLLKPTPSSEGIPFARNHLYREATVVLCLFRPYLYFQNTHSSECVYLPNLTSW
jgi:hypothetical protein